MVRRCISMRPSEWQASQVPARSAGFFSSSPVTRCISYITGRASSGARPWLFDSDFTTARAVGPSIFRLFSAIIRVMVRSQPSGDVRRVEMRDMMPLSSGR